MNIYKEAARKKTRFESTAGLLTVEDLFDLPLSGRGLSLNSIAVGLARKLKDFEVVEDFVSDAAENPEKSSVKLMLDIVKDIIDTKKDEAEQLRKAQEAERRRRLILDIIEKKKMQSLEGLSLEELEKMI